jgi:threonine dehydrogenase-like Zn-dependent dehydrogenase
MKAVVFHKPKDMRVETVPDPEIEDQEDIILRVASTAICGSDLHIFNGFIPQKEPLVMGHEFMGVVEEIGSGVKRLAKGDRVVIPFPIACGHCFFCEHGLPGHCEISNSNYVQACIDELITWLDEGRIVLDDIITHRLALKEAPKGYELFNNKEDGCVKVVLTP